MFLTTVTGKEIYLDKISASDIDIRDIARGLSMESRFNGQTKRFYSVAQHSVRVAARVSEERKLIALLHDATEAYMKDLPTPVKLLLPQYAELETKVWLAIAEHFNLPIKLPLEVKEADYDLFLMEASEITDINMKKIRPNQFYADELGMPAPMASEEILPKQAEVEFLILFCDLMLKRRAF